MRPLLRLPALWGLSLLSALLLGGCQKDEAVELEMTPVGGNGIPAMRLDAYEQGALTKALVGQTTDLEAACAGISGKSIQVFSDVYSLSQELKVSNYFRNSFLRHVTKEGSLQPEWMLVDDALKQESTYYWLYDSELRFRAVFPKESIPVDRNTSNSLTLKATYNTQTLQEDMLVAYNAVRTEPSGISASLYSASWTPGSMNLSNRVPLAFSHSMAALSFKIKLRDSGSSNLVKCWFENTSSAALATAAMFSYGGGTQETMDQQSWSGNAYPSESEKYYEWEPLAIQTFTNTQAVTAYQAEAATGSLFTGNDGYVLVIPQNYTGNANFFFVTKEEGREPQTHQIILPSQNFQAGKRYTYNITLSNNAAVLSVDIEDWNARSTYPIVDVNTLPDGDLIRHHVEILGDNIDSNGNEEWVKDGGDITLTIGSDYGYKIAGITAEGAVDVDMHATYADVYFQDVQEDILVYVQTAEAATYRFNYTSNATIATSLPENVLEGDEAYGLITPEDGYVITGLSVSDGTVRLYPLHAFVDVEEMTQDVNVNVTLQQRNAENILPVVDEDEPFLPYEAGGEAFTFYSGAWNGSTDALEIVIDLSTCTGSLENILSFGSDIGIWNDGGFHLYYTPSTRRIEINDRVSNVNVRDEVFLDSDILVIHYSGTTISFNGVEKTLRTSTLTSVQIGSREGNSRSHATYNSAVIYHD